LTSWEDIEGTFTSLRDFVIEDADRLARQSTGGNFALVALVMTACDAWGRLLYGKDMGDRILERCLPDPWKPAAPTVYDALRHGLLHAYQAQIVMVDGEQFGFAIAWGGTRHFTLAAEDPRLLVIVAPQLLEDLRRVLKDLEAELRDDETARTRFVELDRKAREIHVRSRDQVAAWKTAVTNTPVKTRSE
jgi:hypothetical protein